MSKVYLFTAKPVPGNKGTAKVITVIGAKSKQDALKHAVTQGRDLVFDVGRVCVDRDHANLIACDMSLLLNARTVVIDLNMQRSIGKLLGL